MKKSVIGALFLAAAITSPAYAAFDIECKIQVYETGKEDARPIRFHWDGAEMTTTYTTWEKERKTTSFKPVHFVQRDATSVVSTNYGFVVSVNPNGDRISRTYQVFERDNKQLAAKVVWSLVTPEGVALAPTVNDYRNCTWKKS